MLLLALPIAAAPQPTAAPAAETEAEAFSRAMRIGYAATAQRDYQTALINFRRALQLRPDNSLARDAIANVEAYIERDRILARQREIDRLQAQLEAAHEQRDWVCVATTVDLLMMYTEPNSLNRERLVGYRGEVSGLLDARDSVDSWSTVCTPTRPLY